jgi:hypothetical protein
VPNSRVLSNSPLNVTFLFSDKKSSKPRKRPRQLAFPPETKGTLEDIETNLQESSCFDILSNDLPEMGANKKRK